MNVSVLGHFGEGKQLLNGQTVKTRILTEELERQLGTEGVLRIDTHGGLKILLKAPFQVLRALRRSKNVLILPAHNGLRVYAPLLSVLRRLFRHRRLHYVVIGGWLPSFVARRRWLARCLKRFDGIYVETVTAKEALEAQGFSNVQVLPNCKRLPICAQDEPPTPLCAPYRLCTFSRVMREKGIGTAAAAVKSVNERLGYTAFSLDIYGQVDAEQTAWFRELEKQFPAYIRYCGCVEAHRSVEVLQPYAALLFPTHFFTEGVPGTIIDAYAAAVPVLSARWESYADVVDEGSTGLGYDFDRTEQLEELLLRLASDPRPLMNMKKNCVARAKEYLPEAVVPTLLHRFAP